MSFVYPLRPSHKKLFKHTPICLRLQATKSSFQTNHCEEKNWNALPWINSWIIEKAKFSQTNHLEEKFAHSVNGPLWDDVRTNQFKQKPQLSNTHRFVFWPSCKKYPINHYEDTLAHWSPYLKISDCNYINIIETFTTLQMQQHFKQKASFLLNKMQSKY